VHKLRTSELLDAPALDAALLRESLRDIGRLSRLAGATSSLVGALRRLMRRHGVTHYVSILDAGTGGADIPRAIVRWAKRSGVRPFVLACDRHPQVVGAAREFCAGVPEIAVVEADVTELPYADGLFDYAICSLLLHHLDEEQATRALRKLRAVARRGVLVSDLVRSRLGVIAATVATRLVSSNPLTRHDGPLSVRRAYTLAELRALSSHAGCAGMSWSRGGAFRAIGVLEFP